MHMVNRNLRIVMIDIHFCFFSSLFDTLYRILIRI